jgi:hypothetical protein
MKRETRDCVSQRMLNLESGYLVSEIAVRSLNDWQHCVTSQSSITHDLFHSFSQSLHSSMFLFHDNDWRSDAVLKSFISNKSSNMTDDEKK